MKIKKKFLLVFILFQIFISKSAELNKENIYKQKISEYNDSLSKAVFEIINDEFESAKKYISEIEEIINFIKENSEKDIQDPNILELLKTNNFYPIKNQLITFKILKLVNEFKELMKKITGDLDVDFATIVLANDKLIEVENFSNATMKNEKIQLLLQALGFSKKEILLYLNQMLKKKDSISKLIILFEKPIPNDRLNLYSNKTDRKNNKIAIDKDFLKQHFTLFKNILEDDPQLRFVKLKEIDVDVFNKILEIIELEKKSTTEIPKIIKDLVRGRTFGENNFNQIKDFLIAIEYLGYDRESSFSNSLLEIIADDINKYLTHVRKYKEYPQALTDQYKRLDQLVDFPLLILTQIANVYEKKYKKNVLPELREGFKKYITEDKLLEFRPGYKI